MKKGKSFFFMASLLLIYSSTEARSSKVSECTVLGSRVCITDYIVSMFKKQTGEPRCEAKLDKETARRFCLQFEKQKLAAENKRQDAISSTEIVKDQTRILKRVWECSGDGLRTSVKIEIYRTEIPTKANSQTYTTKYTRHAWLQFDCGENRKGNAFVELFAATDGNLSGVAQARDCADGDHPLTIAINVPMLKDQVSTPIKIEGQVKADIHEMNSTKCKFINSELKIGASVQPGFDTIEIDQSPSTVK